MMNRIQIEVVAVQSKENDVIEIGSDDETEADTNKDSCKTQKNNNDRSQAPYTKQIVHACSDCGLQFATSRENYYHMLENHRESLFKCSHCPSAFIREQSLLRHEQTHKQHQPTSSSSKKGTNVAATTTFKCSSCPRTFDSKEAFVDHESSHREVGEIVSTESQLSESDDSET
uniref:Putative zinc finger protein n=1 Tax=Aedes albopictus TaxID=7160 RepID=A0A023EI11_AEDAL